MKLGERECACVCALTYGRIALDDDDHQRVAEQADDDDDGKENGHHNGHHLLQQVSLRLTEGAGIASH